MNKKEFQNKMTELGLLKKSKRMMEFKKVQYFVDQTRFFILGYYKNKNKNFVAFFKDFERETFKEMGEFATEEEVYDVLVEFIENEE